jgi:hypothetical protein
MAKRRLPSLDATSRHYLENTGRPRLVSPGLERHVVERKRALLIVAALLAVALVGLLAWLARITRAV